MKHFKFVAALTAAALIPLAFAQGVTVDSVIKNLENTQKNTRDFSGRVTGSAEQDNSRTRFEVKIAGITAAKLTRVDFLAPDALADNFLILDNQNSYNYQFITNQVTIQRIANNTQVGGFNLNFNALNDPQATFPQNQVDFKPLTTENTPAGRAYILDGTPKKGVNLDFDRLRVWVLENGWRVYRAQSLDTKNVVQFDVTIPEWKANGGLKVADLCKIPRDAEIIRKGTLRKNSCAV
jgi:outer membrane lipoprotein-sorting protein